MRKFNLYLDKGDKKPLVLKSVTLEEINNYLKHLLLNEDIKVITKEIEK